MRDAQGRFMKQPKQPGEGKLPKEWCLYLTDENRDIVGKWRTCGNLGHSTGYVLSQGHPRAFTKEHKGFHVNEKPKGTPEITFEQFKKYVLNQKEMKDKKIVGYNFKPSMKQYEPAALAIAQLPHWNLVSAHVTSITAISYLKKAAVLDMWFDAVYEDDVPNVEIRGYKSKFGIDAANGQTIVAFGCQTFTRDEILKFVDILDRSGLNLAQYEPEVRKVANYLKKK